MTARAVFSRMAVRVIGLIVWVLAAWSVWAFLGAWLAPDACLDTGHGSFNFQTWQCSLQQQPFVETPVYQVPGFWTCLVFVLSALGINAWIKYRQPPGQVNGQAPPP